MPRSLAKPAPRGSAFSSPARLVRLFCFALLFTLTIALVFTLFKSDPKAPEIARSWAAKTSSFLPPLRDLKPDLAAAEQLDAEAARDEEWSGALKRKAQTAGQRQQERFAETRAPPPLVLPGASRSASPPLLGPLSDDDPVALAYAGALSELSAAATRVVDHHPEISTEEFQDRVAGLPGTGIGNTTEAAAVQDWLNCEASEGQWNWEPRGSSATHLTVHKQGKTEASCDRAFYKHRGAEGGDAKNGWDVRPSLKFRWRSSDRCTSLRPKHLQSSLYLSRRKLCRLLRHKNILMVGDGAAAYSLHDLLLDWTNTKPTTCYGSLYCKEHGLCGDELKEGWNGDGESLERGILDEQVYVNVPARPAKSRSPSQIQIRDEPVVNEGATGIVGAESVAGGKDNASARERDYLAPRELRASPRLASDRGKPRSRGTIFRFRRSDGLWGSPSPANHRFGHTFVHPNFGIREVNNFWMADSRRHDVVILSRPPVPLPRHSRYSEVFARSPDLTSAHHVHLPPRAAEPWTDILQHDGKDAVKALVDMAKRVTLEVWLPEVLFSLLNVRADPAPPGQLIIWRSEWRIQPDCGDGAALPPSAEEQKRPVHEDDRPFAWQSWWSARGEGDGSAPRALPPTLLEILFPGSDHNSSAITDNPPVDQLNVDMPPGNFQTVFHNLQVIFQNHLLRRLLPAFGIAFLDMESPTAIWRSGMIGGAAAPTTPMSPPIDQSNPQSRQKRKSSPSAGKDCLRYCYPSPGGAVEEGFIGGLVRLFEAGWGGSEREFLGTESIAFLHSRRGFLRMPFCTRGPQPLTFRFG